MTQRPLITMPVTGIATTGDRRSNRRPGAALALVGVVACAGVSAAPGDIDPAFGESGRVLFDPFPAVEADNTVTSMTARADGRIVVAGMSNRSGVDAFFVTGFDENGAPDATFGDGGVLEVWSWSGIGDRAAIIEQADGKLVVAGAAGDDLSLWRFHANGIADMSFGDGGVASFDLGGKDEAVAVIEQSDGKLVAATTVTANDDADIAVARFNGDGSVDAAFGDGGMTWVEFPAGNLWEIATALGRDPDGRLIVTGNRFDWENGAGTAAIVRLTADGTPDPAFGEGGVVELDLGGDGGSTVSTAIALQPDGRIVIAGAVGELWWSYLSTSDGFLARLLPDGAIDAGFGTAGAAVTDSLVYGHFETVGIEPDGKIVAAGFEYVEEGARYAGPYLTVSRFQSTGALDATFGTGGTTVVDTGSEYEAPTGFPAAIARQDDGRLVLAGWQNREIVLAGLSAADAGFPGYVGFILSRREAAEESGSLVLGVRRTGGSTGTVSVALEARDDTATGGTDFDVQTGRLEWAHGDTSVKTITIELIDDDEYETVEEFGLRLSDPDGGVMLAASDATIRIISEDLNAQPPPVPPAPPPAVGGGHGGGSGAWLFLLTGVLLLGRTMKTDAYSR